MKKSIQEAAEDYQQFERRAEAFRERELQRQSNTIERQSTSHTPIANKGQQYQEEIERRREENEKLELERYNASSQKHKEHREKYDNKEEDVRITTAGRLKISFEVEKEKYNEQQLYKSFSSNPTSPVYGNNRVIGSTYQNGDTHSSAKVKFNGTIHVPSNAKDDRSK